MKDNKKLKDKVQQPIYLDTNLKNKLKFIAKTESRSLSNLISVLCKDYVTNYENQHGEIIVDESEGTK